MENPSTLPLCSLASRPTSTLSAMLKIFAILAVFTGSVWCVVVTVPEKTVMTTVGRNITLLCTYRTEAVAPYLFIQWSFYSAKEKESTTIYFSQGGQSFSYGEFRGRIQGVNSTGNASITIFNMRASETGAYTCEVFNPADSNGLNEKSVIVNVLAPPSQPHCSSRGTPELGSSISLHCFSEEGLPAPTYQWHKLSGGTIRPVTEPYNPKTGVLVISHLTNVEEGSYRCTATNSLGRKSCQISLTCPARQHTTLLTRLAGSQDY